ncbi:MAG: alpha/beta hydrolase, partial [Gemmataceae bacterium]
MKRLLSICCLALLTYVASAQPKGVQPTKAAVPYGTHARQVLDFYQAKSDNPTPVVFFIHGGGWVAGERRCAELDKYLAAGISVVAISYRFIDD